MNKSLTVLFALSACLFFGTALMAQSGARPAATGGGGGGAGGGGTSSSGDGGGASTGDAAAGSLLGGGNSNGATFFQEGVLNGQANVIRSSGEATYLNALGLRQYEEARRVYLESQLMVLEVQRLKDERKAREREERLQQASLRRQQRERAKQKQVAANSNIAWPPALTNAKYNNLREEIEALSGLYARLDENKGVAAGLDHAIRELAQLVIADEQSGEINPETSVKVREFVIALAETKGQNLEGGNPSSSGEEMIVKNM